MEPGIVVSMVTLVRPPSTVRMDLSVLLLSLAEVNAVRKVLKVSIPRFYCYRSASRIKILSATFKTPNLCGIAYM